VKLTKSQLKQIIREEILKEAKAKRDYKAEYKKFQSSTKSKKYRAELNAYNRKKGTYGNGDGKDASHKGGKIAGFEKESVNRGRREKSRLKKEGKLKEGFSSSLIKKAIAIAKKMGGNMTAAVKKIEKIKKGLSNDPKVDDAIRSANEGKLTEGHKISFSKEEMAKLHNDGELEKAGHTYIYSEDLFNESGILYRAGVKKYGKEGMRKIQQAAGKRKSHAEIGKIKDKYEKDKKEGKIKEAGFGGVSAAPKFSSPEAKKVVDGSLKQYSKELRKTQYRVVKDWMSKAKAGTIDFFDLVRGFETGDASRAYPYETEFLKKVLTRDKIVDRFRKYFGGKKGKKR
jgi:hypothetical protein